MTSISSAASRAGQNERGSNIPIPRLFYLDTPDDVKASTSAFTLFKERVKLEEAYRHHKFPALYEPSTRKIGEAVVEALEEADIGGEDSSKADTAPHLS